MNRRIVIFLLAAGFAALPLAALDVPPLVGRVNDYAGMLSPETAAALEAKLAAFEETDSTQIVVLTVPSLGGDALEEFSMRVADKWKIGQAKKDNGAILLIARGDRKIRIEVGYGLEGRLTDLLAGRIIDRIIAPSFKAGEYDRGVTEGVDAIIRATRGEYKPEEGDVIGAPKREPSSLSVPALFALFVLGIIGKIKRIFSGIGGAVLAPLGGLFLYGLTPWLLVLVPAGFLLGLAMPTLLTIFLLSGGGRGSGGWSGTGGSFGGGFSGGGGGFGGGGASGSW